MDVVILCGGKGTRLSEETNLRPKPMVEIGTKPIIWHIMKLYYFFGYNDFIICTVYKSNYIKSYSIIEIHPFLSFWGMIVVHPYLARGTGACPHPPHLQKTQVLAASNPNDLVQLSLLYIPKGFG